MDALRVSAITPTTKVHDAQKNTQRMKHVHKDKKQKSFADILKAAMK